MLAIEANDEWLVGRSYISQGSMQVLYDKQSDASPLFQIRTGGRRAHRRVSTNVFTDEMSADFLHHVPGLDSSRLTTLA